MKTVTRAFVLALVLSGAVASAHTVSSRTSDSRIVARNTMIPQPMCPPDGSTDCGFGK